MTFRIMILLVILLVVMVSLKKPDFAEELRQQVVRGSGAFYRLQEGAVAYLPVAKNLEDARATIEFRVLAESGNYSLKKRPSHWFIVNHRTSGSSKTTYLGILIIPVYPHNRTPDFGVYLYRNNGWKRENSGEFATGEVKETYETKTILDFVNAHAQSNLSEMDSQFYPLQWHGIPKFGTNHSWAKRERWKHNLIVDESKFRASFTPPIPETTNFLLKAYLIRFTPTQRATSDKRLIFHFDGRNLVAAHLKLFSPNTPKYDAQYFLSFK